MVGVVYFGPIFGIACIICYKNRFDLSMLKPFMKFLQSDASLNRTTTELVLLNLCIQCLTEFLKIRTCFLIVG